MTDTNINTEKIQLPNDQESVQESAKILEELHQKQGRENLEKWEHFCKLIGDFKTQYKRLPSLRSVDQAEKVLARWIFLQKACYNRNKMHPYHIRRLKEIGINLN